MVNAQMIELTMVIKPVNATVQKLDLFHGTKSEAVKEICDFNFDWRRSGESSGLSSYGVGAYFSTSSSISLRYSVPDPLDGTRYMFVAIVVVGTMCVGNPAMKYPDIYRANVGCDTSVDNLDKPRIYVKYRDAEYYPSCLIHYK
jgi:hypothetical protein